MVALLSSWDRELFNNANMTLEFVLSDEIWKNRNSKIQKGQHKQMVERL